MIIQNRKDYSADSIIESFKTLVLTDESNIKTGYYLHWIDISKEVNIPKKRRKVKSE